ncbi:MAG TPA: hypothetical protein VFQ44_30980 [Streptosporangiaceae bacterium]|nr:hypothetical protein [Streptosporangiaceae bacterium]
MTRWAAGERTVTFLIDRGRLEGFRASDPAATASALTERAGRRLEATARAALANGDPDGAYAAAYDAYGMAGEALLARQLLRATGGEGSHMAVGGAVSAQFSSAIAAFAKPVFEQLRRTRHNAQYFDPDAPPITEADAAWAIGKATAALTGARTLLGSGSPDAFD